MNEHGILNNHSTYEGNDMIDNELEVIATDDYQFVGFHEDDRKIMLKELKTRRSLYLAKNDKIRIMVKCKGVVSQSFKAVDGGGPSTRSRQSARDWLVKTVQDEHKCLQTRAVKACTSRYSNPKIQVKALHEDLCKKLVLGMSLQKVARVKTMVECIISGDYEIHYGFLRDYVLEILNTNLGTIVRINIIYVCLGALKLGFKIGLRDFIGVDGTFLKGPYHGQVLTIVGLDSNNGIYPVAYAMVEPKSTSSWTWFLELLGEDLDLGANSNFTFIYDRQKWKGKDLSDHLWECGRETTVNHFNRAMYKLKKFNEEAHAWVFKSKVDEGRDKPIITCLEYIRQYLMKRLCVVQKEIDKCEGPLTPTTTTMFDKIKTDAAKYVAKYNGVGRPKKKRRRGVDEPNIQAVGWLC
uniref:MULE transposase domain-containing protein n=1 Tax=Lactuca sativa TaxID=4236 RepID=A0A9R1UM04_LACSA|nr:hypothetical protein LSAT_V11C800394380 [Lactuca sativa]